MKEKKLLVAVLLSMAFQIEAVRSPLMSAVESDDSDAQARTKEKEEKKEKRRKEIVEEKEKARKRREEKEKKKQDDGKKTSKRSYRNEGLEKTKEELAPLQDAVAKKHAEVREKRQQRKDGMFVEERQSVPTKLVSAKSAQPTKVVFIPAKEVKERQKKEKQQVKEIKAASKPMDKAEKRDKDRMKAHEKAEKRAEEKRKDIQQSIDKLEDRLATLQSKKREKMAEISKKGDHGKTASHVINVESVDGFDKDIQDVKERLAHWEEKMHKLSADYKEDHLEEYYNREALSTIYKNNQKTGRGHLADVKAKSKATRIEEAHRLAALEDNNTAAYQKHLLAARDARKHKDTALTAYHEKVLGLQESPEMMNLRMENHKVRNNLAVLREKTKLNDKALAKVAKITGMKPLKQQKKEERLDAMIAGDQPAPRMYSEDVNRMKARQEDLQYAEKKSVEA